MKKQILKNQRGQTLIEYLIIVALVGVGSIALMRTVGQRINIKFAEVVESLGGKVEKPGDEKTVTSAMLKLQDMRNFAKGKVGGKKKQESNEDSDTE